MAALSLSLIFWYLPRHSQPLTTAGEDSTKWASIKVWEEVLMRGSSVATLWCLITSPTHPSSLMPPLTPSEYTLDTVLTKLCPLNGQSWWWCQDPNHEVSLHPNDQLTTAVVVLITGPGLWCFQFPYMLSNLHIAHISRALLPFVITTTFLETHRSHTMT